MNNPHFLIMQGRITKVLNMKPIEILGMIEEAAGTRMFETKKRKAVETIEKKETKLVEITRVMEEDINPRLEKLSAQRTQSVHRGHRTSRPAPLCPEPWLARATSHRRAHRPSHCPGVQVPRVHVAHH